MRFYGYREDVFKEDMSVADVAEFVGVTPNTIRNWIRAGELVATQKAGEMRITRAALSDFLRRVRIQRSRLGSLSASELSDSLPVLAELLGYDIDRLERECENLEDQNLVTLVPHGNDFRVLVSPGSPDSEEGKALIRVLLNEYYPRDCPWCGKRLPRMLRAPDDMQTPVWCYADRKSLHPRSRRFIDLVLLTIHCPSCRQQRGFVWVNTTRTKATIAFDVAEVVIKVLGQYWQGTGLSSYISATLENLRNKPDDDEVETRYKLLTEEIPVTVVRNAEDSLGKERLQLEIMKEFHFRIGVDIEKALLEYGLSCVSRLVRGKPEEWRRASEAAVRLMLEESRL